MIRRRDITKGFTLIELLVVIAIFAVLVGLLVSAVQRVREAANRTRCISNLRQHGLSLAQYHGTYASFPPGVASPDGSKDPYPFMSWNTRLLPFLEQNALWSQSQQAFAQEIDFRKDPPHVGFGTVMKIYTCPSDARSQVVMTVTGLGVAFTDYLGNEGIDYRRKDGVLFVDSGIRLGDITDGTSNTLLVGERPPSADGFLGWWYAGWGQNLDGSAEVVLGVQERNIYHLARTCPAGPYSYGPGKPGNMCDAFHFWSLHPNGANFLFCDGSVHFIPYAAAPIMPALATRAGGEAVNVDF
jgi:prepilin-type N-terminal cleavage/methylation domain-containing protein/prepilin-type processing-associated H-X9-DG protein